VGDSGGMVTTVQDALHRLGRTDVIEAERVRVLAGGMSGSAVYAFVLDGKPVVVKWTVQDRGDAGMVQRAQREVRFYRELARIVPVRVPRLLGSTPGDAGDVLLLLEASEPAPPPSIWPDADYAGVARDLGRFHTAMRSVALPSWVPAAPATSAEQCRAATDAWRSFASGAGRGIVPDSLLRHMERTIAQVPERDARLDSGALTLCHGDFHTGNLLRRPDGTWVWADWQEVRIGAGVDDLAFFWQRAFAATEADAGPPFDAIVEAYWAGVNDAGDPGTSRETFSQTLRWAELRGWLVAWPPYLGYLSQTQRRRVVARIAALLDASQDAVGWG